MVAKNNPLKSFTAVGLEALTLPHLVGPLKGRSVEEGLRPPHVRVRYAAGLPARQGHAVGEALVELIGGLVVHAVHHVQVAQPKVDLNTTQKRGAEKRYTSVTYIQHARGRKVSRHGI